jgi:hypothetical protein
MGMHLDRLIEKGHVNFSGGAFQVTLSSPEVS